MKLATIISVIDSLAAKGLAFSNEQDFQFALAAEIKKLPDVKNVYFEVPSFSKPLTSKPSLTKSDREYTDLVVEMVDGTFTALELKYKTPGKICTYETCKSTVVTLKQGTYDFASYDFLKDVVRLENIGTRYFLNGLKISKAYAILLTNDKNYRFNCFGKSKVWSAYSLCEKKKSIGAGTLLFGGSNPKKYLSFTALTLKHKYSLDKNWHDYELKGKAGVPYSDYQDKANSSHPGFSYLVLEVF